MTPTSPLYGESKSPLLPLAAILFSAAIFIVDTFTPLGIAVAVLYVVVVLMAGRFFQRTGVLAVGFACIGLTILSYALQHGETYGPPFIRCLVSIAAIGITTFLALRIQSAGAVLREQANLLDITHDAVIVRDPNDVITFWNRGAEELYGWSSDEAVGRVSHQLLATIFPLPIEEVKATLLETGRWEGELVHRKKDGSEVVAASRWSVQRNQSGREIAILETNNDITERKRAEDALRRSEANLADAQRLSKTGSFEWEVASGKIRWSEEAYRIFEHDPKVEPTLELVRSRTHPDDRPSFIAALEGVMAERQQNWELEHRIVMPGGAVKTVHVVAHASEATDRLEYIGALMDTTDTKRAQEALQQAQAELAHVTRVTTLGELTASIAHEVNQPLAAVITNAESCLRWLGRETPEVAEAQNATQRIVRDAHRASEVIRRIRDLATYSTPERAPFGINEAVYETLNLLQRELSRHNVVLRLDLAPSRPKVLGDRVQLQQVIINLVMNGAEAMSSLDGGRRELKVGSRLHEQSDVLVTVQDSGIGIAPEIAEKLFNAFFTTKQGGMGMGLSICRSIIEAHDGKLWATGNEGPGAAFQFTLPLHREEAT